MDNFERKFSEALLGTGSQILDDYGMPMTAKDLTHYFESHTIYKVGEKWYTRSSLFMYGSMYASYAKEYKGESMLVMSLKYYGLNDCIVCGLAVAEYDGKFGLFPLEERDGTQSGIWSCVGYPFIYDDVKVYVDWDKWDDYGYVAVKQEDKWGVIKITQFPEPSTSLAAEIVYNSPEEAMKAAGEENLPKEDVKLYSYEVK